MSAVSGRTRLGLEILAAGAGVGVAGDALLRAVPWGLNALLCTTGLVAAAAWLVRRHRVAASSDAPWLAAAALLIASNFVARDSRTLHAFDTIGLVIVLAVAFPSIQGVGLRGRQAWHYVRAGCGRYAPSRSVARWRSRCSSSSVACSARRTPCFMTSSPTCSRSTSTLY